MRSRSLRRLGALFSRASACVVVFLLALNTPAEASALTFLFSGQVQTSHLDAIPLGTSYTGSYTFESTAKDMNTLSDRVGVYGLGSMTLQIVSRTFSWNGSGNGTIWVEDRDIDAYSVNAQPLVRTSGAPLYDDSGYELAFDGAFLSLHRGQSLLFSGDALLTTPPDLANVSDMMVMNFSSIDAPSGTNSSWSVFGSIASLTMAPAMPVPEPGTFVLALAGLGAFTIAGRRGKRSRKVSREAHSRDKC